MASADFEKHSGRSAAMALFRHTTKDWRETHRHANPHIDVTMTYLNTSISGLESGRDGAYGHDLTYSEMCDKYDRRMAELDAIKGQSRRKDRIDLVSIEVPLPEGVPEERSDEWFLRVAGIVRARCGEKNLIDGHIDRDEAHEYVNPETKETVTSRVHCTYYVIPADPKNGDRLRANKYITTKPRMAAFNRDIEAMTQRDFGCKFMTGAKKKSTKTVGQLKAESEAAALEREIERQEFTSRVLAQALNARRGADEALAEAQRERERAEADAAEARRLLEDARDVTSPSPVRLVVAWLCECLPRLAPALKSFVADHADEFESWRERAFAGASDRAFAGNAAGGSSSRGRGYGRRAGLG